MNLFYNSTRCTKEKVTASQAILKGLSSEGGLFVPERIPQLTLKLEQLIGKTYQETAYEVMKLYFTDFTEAELKECIQNAYDDKFDTPAIAPLKMVGEMAFLELFHGATIAFKDMALSILPHLMTIAAKKNQVKNDIVILTATSGDTGKAALAGFADVPGTKIIVFYPKDGVSLIQQKQMTTQSGSNTFVVGVEDNFDAAQTGVKKMFSNPDLEQLLQQHGYQFSSANSINIGRLVPQIAYYVYAYGKMAQLGRISPHDPLNFVVPTGNFGNILAAYYAKNMGLPIGKLICASNENKVLYDFFQTGKYDKNRPFHLTCSPSMDILISSNLERLIYQCVGRDAVKNCEMMESLTAQGNYQINATMQSALLDFYGNFATESETFATIKAWYEQHGYVMDPHTAVAACVYEKYQKETADHTAAVLVSTASPYKFPHSVMTAIDPKYADLGDFALLDKLEQISGVKIPQAVEAIRQAGERHKTVCKTTQMQAVVEQFLHLEQ
jgi:threonine synthase